MLALVFAFMVVAAKPMVEDTVSTLIPPREEPKKIEFDTTAPTESNARTLIPTEEQRDRQTEDLKPQTDDDEPWEKEKGQDPEFLTDHPFNDRARTDVLRTKGMPGGKKGGPLGGRKNGGPQGSTPGKPRSATNEAVLNALRWLARHQNENGSWGVQSHLGRCGRIAGDCKPNPQTASADFDAGATGLSLLAFLGAGYTHLSKDTHDGLVFGDVVRKGLQWLMTQQDARGGIGMNGHKSMYNHSIAALALVEAYGLTGSTLFQDNAQRAIDFLLAAQNPGRGWRYEALCGDNDTSVTGWAVMALKSADLGGLRVPRAAYDGVRAWLDEVTEESYYRAGYTHKGTGKVYCAHNEAFNHHEALTAIAVMSRIFIDRNADARVKGGADLLARDLPKTTAADVDYYYWYYASLALFQLDNGRGERWEKWNQALTEALLKTQNGAPTGCKSGSWEPADRWSCEGGRVYATAINALTLEVYYRYESVFTGSRK
jgi:hypothetical protein